MLYNYCGDTVTISTQLKNENADEAYTYKFSVYDTATEKWTTLQDFTSNSTYTWKTTDAGDKRVYVDVKDSKGNVIKSNAVDVNVEKVEEVEKPLTISATKQEADKTVTFTANGTGGSGKYTYKFLIYNPATKQWAKLQDFSATSKLTWKAGSVGERQFYVDVKDKNGNTVRSSVMNVKTSKSPLPLIALRNRSGDFLDSVKSLKLLTVC